MQLLSRPLSSRVSPMATSHHVAVHCAGVTKSYGTGSATVTALHGVDLEVYAGELLMLVGPSGCGEDHADFGHGGHPRSG